MSAADDNGRELTGDDALAADYVLGALDGDDRRAAARRIETEPGFARLVERWEEHMAPARWRRRKAMSIISSSTTPAPAISGCRMSPASATAAATSNCG